MFKPTTLQIGPPRDLTTRRRSRIRSFVIISILALLMAALQLGGATASPGGSWFVDDDGNAHEADIEALAAAGITDGCTTNGPRFCPTAALTRAQAVTMIVRALDLPASPTDYFNDDTGSPHELAINAAAYSGLTSGCDEALSRFCPSSTTTRAQLATMLVRGLGLSGGEGSDAFDDDDSSPHERDINRLAAEGITRGCSTDSFCPNAAVTRDQIASFLVRALELPPWDGTNAPGSGAVAFWGEGFPSPESTGSRVPYSEMASSGAIVSSHDNQVIERVDVTGNVIVKHDNVTVRDSRISFTSTYGLEVEKKSDGSCPSGTLFEYVEVDGRLAAENDIPVYSAGCEWTLDHAYLHDMGRPAHLVRGNTVTNSFIYASRTGDSGAHRGAVAMHGGSDHVIRNNVLLCEGSGCSASIPMYGSVAPIENVLVEHNLMAATAAYCAYGGSVDSKRYPDGSNVRFIDNHFSTRFFPDCGRSGPIASFESGVRGNVWQGNVWHETGAPIP